MKKHVDLLKGPVLSSLTRLAIPIMATSLIQMAYNLTDMIWIGRIGSDAVAAVGAAGMYMWLSNGLASLAKMGGQVNVGYALGSERKKEASLYTANALQLSVILGLIYGLICSGFNSPLIGFFKLNSPHVISDARMYLVITCGFVIFSFLNQTFTGIFTAIGNSRAAFLATTAGLLVNIILDPILIFGIGPFPELGVQGAALATVIARYIEALIVVIWAHIHRGKNRYLEGAYTGFGIPLAELKAILIKGFPLMMNEVLWAAGMTTVTQCYSVRGLDVVAGLNIASTITNLFNIVYLQLGSCISIVVGQYLGAGKLEDAKDADNKMIVFSVFCCVIMAALMFVVGGFFPGIYNTTEEIRELATSFIAVSAIIMPFCAFSHASYFTLRSGGKTVVTFLFDSVFTWVIVVPAAYLLAHFTGLGIVSIYFLVQGTELIKVIIGYLMVKSNVWVVQMV